MVRARFAATELGIRERLMIGILAESSLAVAMNASLGRHVPKIHVFADASRIDTELAQLTNLSPYKWVAVTISLRVFFKRHIFQAERSEIACFRAWTDFQLGKVFEGSRFFHLAVVLVIALMVFISI